MTDKLQDQASLKSLFINWMKRATASWGSMASVWTGVAEEAEAATTSKKDGKTSPGAKKHGKPSKRPGTHYIGIK
jgi:hypothetical protein